MSRTRRIVVPGAPHHVYLRGNNRRRLFSSLADRLHFVRCLERGLEITACQLHQLTLMSNHVHLVSTPPDPLALSRLVHRVGQRYAQQRNANRHASGKLFEERFHSKVITDDQQLMATTLYNDANAFRAGMVGDPLGHAWSTGPLHAATGASRIPRSLWTPSGWYLALGTTPEARGDRYRAIMASYTGQAHAPPSSAALDRERHDDEPYRYRVERPDRSSAREAATRWPEKG